MNAGALKDRWQANWRRLGVAPPVGLFESIVQRYSEPHLRYHTLQHLEECFARLDEFGDQVPHLAEVELALWFHDAISDVFNEKRHEILHRFLERPRIFITREFFQRYEERARANLAASLSGGSS